MSTGQWFTDRIGTRWFFDAGALGLDFAYTGDFGYSNPSWERLHTPLDLTAWLTERFGPLSSPATPADLASARRLRDAITAIARAVAANMSPQSEPIDVLNDVAAQPDLNPVLAGGSIPPSCATVPRALSMIARDAIHVFAESPDRIRRCGADDCGLIFFDGSRPGVRRWCSMQRCGNRAKVRNHRSRTKEQTP